MTEPAAVAVKTASTRELKALFRLSLPIIISQLAQSLMGIVDTIVVAPLGTDTIAAVGFGALVLMSICIPLAGLLVGLDTEVSHSVGSGRLERAGKLFGQTVYLTAVISFVQIALVYGVAHHLAALGVRPEIAVLTERYLSWTLPGTLAITFIFASTKFIQGHGESAWIMIVAIAANIFNYFATSSLTFGHFGLPALGVVGAGIATTASRWFMVFAHLWLLARPRFRLDRTSFSLDPILVRRLLALGIPAALQMLLEIGLFTAASFMMARFEPRWLAAHNILLQIVTFTFMVPLGISAAAAVRVGHAMGRGQSADAVHRGNIAIVSGGAFMVLSGIALSVAPGPIVALFGAPVAVVECVQRLIVFAALFQIFDGLQVTITGALRGLGNTRSSFIASLLGHWLIAMPVAVSLAFFTSVGPPGVWSGLATGLIVVACMLCLVWRHQTRQLLSPAGVHRT